MTIDLPVETDLTCDECGRSVIVNLTEYCGDPATVGFNPDNDMPEGWVEYGDDHHCPDCKESDDDE